MKKLAFIEVHQETNSFSSIPTSLREFENFGLKYGADIWPMAKKHKLQGLGFQQAVEKYGQGQFEILPIISAWAYSGGPLETSVYERFKAEAMAALQNQPDLAGIYCSLHGAMGVIGMRDPESDFLTGLREIVGHKMPIAVSFDLHANVTRENVHLATLLLGYRTNPHRDHRKTGLKAGELLIQTVRGEVRPTMAYRKLRMIKGGGIGIEFLPPMRSVFRRMRSMERQSKVLRCSNFMVHPWMDDPELGWSVTVVTDNDQALAEQLAEELAERNWAVRKRKHPTPKPVEEAIRIAKRSWIRRRLGTTIFCDVSDVVGAGAPGANTNILKALLEQAPELKSYVPVRDPGALAELGPVEVGQEVSLTVGGRIDPEFNPVVPFHGEVIFAENTPWGKTLVILSQGIHLLLTEIAFPAYFTSDYKAVGLNLWKADITVVKNLFPFRFKFIKYNRKSINVLTRGTTTLDVKDLPYTDIPRPLFPLDAPADWR